MNSLIKIIIIILYSSIAASSILAQDINFDDLQRVGSGLIISKTVSGLASEGSNYMKQFTETDGARIEARRQAAASYASSSSSSSSGSSGGGNWTCQFSCLAALYTGTGHKYSLTVSASNEDKAWENMNKRADEICRADKPGNGQWASKTGLCKRN